MPAMSALAPLATMPVQRVTPLAARSSALEPALPAIKRSPSTRISSLAANSSSTPGPSRQMAPGATRSVPATV